MANKIYTVKDVSEILNVHPNTIKNMISDGRLRAWKTRGNTGHYRFNETDVNDYLEREGLPGLAFKQEKPLPVAYGEENETLDEEAIYIATLQLFREVGSPLKVFGSYMETLTLEEYANQLKGRAHIWVLETIRQAELAFSDSVLAQVYPDFAYFIDQIKIGIAGKNRLDGGLTLTSVLLIPNGIQTRILDGTLQQFHSYLGPGLIELNWKERHSYYLGMQAISLEKFKTAILDRNGYFFQSFLRKIEEEEKKR